MNKDTSWGGEAEWYDELVEGEGSYQRDLILPNLLRLMEIKKGEKILDLGCGQGFFCRAFHEEGATVTGIDLGEALIEIAKSKSSPAIKFSAQGAQDLSSFENSVFDKISIVLALQNMEQIPEVLKESNRVLNDGGKLYLVLNHPAFRIAKKSSWDTDSKGKMYRRVDEYISESKTEISMHPGKVEESKTISFHHPLQFYFKNFEKSGFGVVRLEEWVSNRESEAGPKQSEENRVRKEFPLFMSLVLVKL